MSELKLENSSCYEEISNLEIENNYSNILNFRLKILLLLIISILAFVLYVIFTETPHIYDMYYYKSKKISLNVINISYNILNTSYFFFEDLYNNLNTSNISVSYYIDNLEDFNL